MKETNIPKIIHYCWFGKGEKPADVLYCINTGKKYLPDYKIMEWNENNFSIDNANQYVKEAYRTNTGAYVADYVRLYALDKYGGIYFDTDVEVFKSFDNLLDNQAFFGFESNDYLMTAVMATKKENNIIKKFLDYYKYKKFDFKNEVDLANNTNVVIFTKLMNSFGLKLNGEKQEVKEATIYPQYYFSANDFINIFNKYKKHSYSYHHYYASGSDKKNKKGLVKNIRHYILGKARNIIGTNALFNLKHNK